jgi:hypothetical protein
MRTIGANLQEPRRRHSIVQGLPGSDVRGARWQRIICAETPLGLHYDMRAARAKASELFDVGSAEIIKDGRFKRVGDAALDDRKRLSLAKVAEHLKSVAIDENTELRFGIYVNDLGQLLLTPEVSVPMHELWLLRNPEALAKVKEGLRQAAAGEARSVGSFAKYAKDEID